MSESYTIRVRKGRVFWWASVTGKGIGKYENPPTFHAFKAASARAKAEAWCDQQESKRSAETYRYEAEGMAMERQA